MNKYIVQIDIEFDKRPNDKDVREYLNNTCKKPHNLRWDLQTPTNYILDAQAHKEQKQ